MSDFLKDLKCEIEKQQYITKKEFEQAQDCPIVKGEIADTEGISGESDIKAFSELEKDVDQMIADREAEVETIAKKMQECYDELKGETDKLKEKIDLSVKIKEILYKLYEIRDNLYPVNIYHSERKSMFMNLKNVHLPMIAAIDKKEAEIVVVDNSIVVKKKEKIDLIAAHLGFPPKNDLNKVNNDIAALEQLRIIKVDDLGKLKHVYVLSLRENVYDIEEADPLALLNKSIEPLAKLVLGGSESLQNYAYAYSTALRITTNNFYDNITLRLNNNNVFSVDLRLKKYNEIMASPYLITKEFLSADLVNNFRYIRIGSGLPLIGALYVEYWNKFDDPLNKFFTAEERGLTDDFKLIDPVLEDSSKAARRFFSGAPSTASIATVKQTKRGFYIHDLNKFQEFFKNFKRIFEDRVEKIRREKVFPARDDIADKFKAVAKFEARYYVSEFLTNNKTVADIINRSDSFLDKFKMLESEIDQLKGVLEKLERETDPNTFLNNVKKIDCVKDNLPEEAEAPDQDIDLKKSFGTFNTKTNEIETSADPENPHPGKHCYWLKFANLATQFGLLPFPDIEVSSGMGMRYWPVGLVIPTPTKLVKIPLPIVWIPLLTISASFGTIVFFLGQCGVLPCPYVFFMSNMGTKKFAITLRGPSKEFGYEGDMMKETFKIPLIALKPIDPLEKIAIDGLKRGEQFEDIVAEIEMGIMQKIDDIGTPKLKWINDVKRKISTRKDKNVNSIPLSEKVDAIRADLNDYINDITLPKFTIPKDHGKLEQITGVEKIKKEMKNFKTHDFKMPEMTILDVKEKIIGKTIDLFEDDDIDKDIAALPENIDLNDKKTLNRIKVIFRKINKKTFDKISEESLISSKWSMPEVTVSIPFICKDIVKKKPVDLVKVQQLLLLYKIVETVVNQLTVQSLRSMLGFDKFPRGMVLNVYINMIRSMVPNLILPRGEFGGSFVDAFKFMMVGLLPMAIPKLNSKLGISLLKHPITIDLNTIKKLIVNTISTQINQYIKLLPFDINHDGEIGFGGLSGIDIKILIKRIISAQINILTDPIKPIYNSVATLVKLRNIEINFMDMIMAPVKTLANVAKAVAKDQSLVKIIEVPVVAAMAVTFALLEKLENVPYPVTATLCAFGGTGAVRALHPLLYADDLPPWERLDLSNFLLVAFLDEFCHQGKKYGGFYENFLP